MPLYILRIDRRHVIVDALGFAGEVGVADLGNKTFELGIAGHKSVALEPPSTVCRSALITWPKSLSATDTLPMPLTHCALRLALRPTGFVHFDVALGGNLERRDSGSGDPLIGLCLPLGLAHLDRVLSAPDLARIWPPRAPRLSLCHGSCCAPYLAVVLEHWSISRRRPGGIQRWRFSRRGRYVFDALGHVPHTFTQLQSVGTRTLQRKTAYKSRR